MRFRIAPSRIRLTVAALAAAALVVAPAASASTSNSAKGNDRATSHDISFIAMLVPHHQSAVEMAEVARAKATNAEVRQLAAHIAGEQSGQIRQMEAWLSRQGAKPEPPPAPVREMEQQDLQMLRSAEGAMVDRMFLMMMRPHHAQAVAEAIDELEHGRDRFALDVARTTKTDQSRELARMNDLLAALG
ncbi:DUF305 domain-containing protein [Amycolatopsis tucumanensis]|uniref:DUF305 domain-containing protein n=1 Tax=Amycolatopsis tucumanensis TaxID=401106 RepID=A0ABP7JW03_9PSEU|nr:DUF305 domain-containing protein [Amycolatopsis tucumanensis]MCF6427683.1 DUF305 domain-containing protein [Amycolatopsis tucumanensis]